MKRPGSWLGLATLAGIVVALVVLSSGGVAAPFDPDSAAPDGYRAIAILLADDGVRVDTVSPGDLGGGDPGAGEGVPGGFGPGDGLVLPVAEYVGDEQLESVRAAAAAGATVVVSGEDFFYPVDSRTLVRSPASPVPRGRCDMSELQDLESIDDIAGGALEVPDGTGAEVCFADGFGAVVTRELTGDGSITTISSPYLWANARLQPDKEEGGRALDNGGLAVALLGELDSVTFVDADPPSGVTPDGTKNPLSLIPLPVRLAMAQLVGAFLVYAWWRSRRLGRPVREAMPVEVAGSELVEAVGGLLRRSGSAQRAARVLRGDLRRELSSRLGVPLDGDPTAMVDAISSRTGRDPDEVRSILCDSPVDTTSQLVALSRALDDLHSEVLNVQPTA